MNHKIISLIIITFLFILNTIIYLLLTPLTSINFSQKHNFFNLLIMTSINFLFHSSKNLFINILNIYQDFFFNIILNKNFFSILDRLYIKKSFS
jgi:hypothetical protein